MKKYSWFLTILLIIALVFIGCTVPSISNEKDINDKNNDQKEESEKKVETIEDYYPFLENTIMEYDGIGNEFAEQVTFTEFVEDNRIQLKVLNPGTTMITILERSRGELKEIFSEAEFYYSENMIDKENKNNNVLLKEPLEKGTSWKIEDGYKRSITGVGVDIKLPYKRLQALEVTTELDEGVKQYDYYAKGIGHVASIYKDGDFEVRTVLKDIKQEVLSVETKFYYPLNEKAETIYVEKDIKISTNEKIEEILESNFKNPGINNLAPLISKDTKINSIELDRGSRIVKIDFSKELLNYIEEFEFKEERILQSIVNTLGDYYGTERVYISIDDRPYNSKNLSIKEDGYFKIDLDNIEKFK